MPTSDQNDAVCRRRLATHLSLKQQLTAQISRNDSALPLPTAAPALCSLTNSLLQQSAAASCACAICGQVEVQRQVIRVMLANDAAECEKKKQKQKATAAKPESKKPVAAAVAKSESSSSKSAEEVRAAVLDEVRSLVQGLKDEAISVSKAVHDSDAKLEQRQHSLEKQVADTTKAAKKAHDADALTGMDAGAMGEAIIRLCGKVAPAAVVNAFVRPLVASLFQVLWMLAVFFTAVSTVYLMISAPK